MFKKKDADADELMGLSSLKRSGKKTKKGAEKGADKPVSHRAWCPGLSPSQCLAVCWHDNMKAKTHAEGVSFLHACPASLSAGSKACNYCTITSPRQTKVVLTSLPTLVSHGIYKPSHVLHAAGR